MERLERNSVVQLTVRSLLAGIAAVSSSQVLTSALDYREENASVRGGKWPLSARVERAALVGVCEGRFEPWLRGAVPLAGRVPSGCAAALCARWIYRGSSAGGGNGRLLHGRDRNNLPQQPDGQQARTFSREFLFPSCAHVLGSPGQQIRGSRQACDYTITPGCTFCKKFSS